MNRTRASWIFEILLLVLVASVIYGAWELGQLKERLAPPVTCEKPIKVVKVKKAKRGRTIYPYIRKD